MKLLYFATRKITEKISQAIDYGSSDAIKLDYWLAKVQPQPGAHDVYAIHADDLAYDDEGKKYGRTGISFFRFTDQTVIDKYALQANSGANVAVSSMYACLCFNSRVPSID